MDIEIKEFDGQGYSSLISFRGWRVAMVNYFDKLDADKICKRERHLETDEVFVLLQGNATLHIGIEMKKYVMEIGKLYNVKKGQWHCITMEEGAKVVVIESDDTDDTNTERFFWNEDKRNV